MDKQDKILTCKNCGSSIDLEDKYCQNCGQVLKNKKVSFIDIISDFFNTFFILDFKLFSSLKAIFIPGKLTKEYFSGKHGSYNSPWRIFFVSAVIMLVVYGFDSKIIKPFKNKDKTTNKSLKFENLNFYVTKGFNFSIDTTHEEVEPQFNIDSIKDKLTFDEYKYIDNLYTNFDTAFEHSNEAIKFVLDSSVYVMNSLLKDIYFDSVRIFDTKVSRYDLKNFSIGDLRKKYSAKKDTSVYNKLLERFIYNQNINKLDSSKIYEFLIQNLNWFLVFLLPFAALIFKLLYIRRKRFLIEHLVFNLHNHSAILFLYSFFTILTWINFEFFDSFRFSILFFPFLYYILSMKKYYAQSWIKTFFKSILFSILYFWTMVICGIAYVLMAAIFLYTVF